MSNSATPTPPSNQPPSNQPPSNQPACLLTQEQISAMAGTQKIHFLNPNARRINKSLGDATGLSGLGVHHVELPPGADSTECHRHYQEDECVYVLSGTATVFLDEQAFPVGPGDFIGLRAGGPAHLFHNTGTEPFRCLVIGQRLPFDVADYTRLGKRLYRHDGGWDLVDASHIEDPKAHPGSTVGSK